MTETLTLQLSGTLTEITPNGDYVVRCPDAPSYLQVHYLKSWQARSARVGDRVTLAYRSTPSFGGWVVTEVLR